MRIFSKIHKILTWIPILWKDEDWDYEYLLDIIAFKLKRMRATFIKDDIVSAQDLRKIINNIDNVLSHINNYLDPTCEKFESIYGQSPVQITPLKDLNEEEEEKLSEYLKLHHEFEQNEWNNIWDTLKTEAQTFWD